MTKVAADSVERSSWLAKAPANHRSMLGSPQDKADSLIAVRTRPGLMANTVTPCPRVSAAMLSLSRYNGLAHDVSRQHRECREPGSAGDVDDAAMTPAQHARQDRPCAVQRPAHIDLQRLPPLVGVGRAPSEGASRMPR